MGDEPITEPEEFDTLGDFVSHIVDKTRKGFLEGRNHQKDIDALIWLFLDFRWFSYLKVAVDWGNARGEQAALDELWKDAMDREKPNINLIVYRF